jgi:hypothetical protein
MASYRPELLGIFGVLISLEALSKTFPQQSRHRHIQIIQVEIFSDNEAAVQISQDQSDGKYISPTVAAYDTLLTEIKALQQRLKHHYRIISHHFKLDEKTVKKFFVMLAPNCEKDAFKPPASHSRDYYFPETIIFLLRASSQAQYEP